MIQEKKIENFILLPINEFDFPSARHHNSSAVLRWFLNLMHYTQKTKF